MNATADRDILELVHRLMHDYRSLKYRSLRSGSPEITHMDSKVLSHVDEQPGASQRELVIRSGRDKAQVARLIKGLRDRGLLSAKVDDNDRRSVRLSLTERGRSVQRALRKQDERLKARAIAGLSDTELKRLYELLSRVRENLVGQEN